MDDPLRFPSQVQVVPPGTQYGFQSQFAHPYMGQYFPASVQALDIKLEITVKSAWSWGGGNFEVLDELKNTMFKVKRKQDRNCCCCCPGEQTDSNENNGCCDGSMTFHVLDETETEVIRIERRVQRSCCSLTEDIDFCTGNGTKLGSCHSTGSRKTMEITNQAGDRLLTTKYEWKCCQWPVVKASDAEQDSNNNGS